MVKSNRTAGLRLFEGDKMKYQVQPGDTLSAIGQRLGLPYQKITGYSSGDPNLIYPGENLNIPDSNNSVQTPPTNASINAPMTPMATPTPNASVVNTIMNKIIPQAEASYKPLPAIEPIKVNEPVKQVNNWDDFTSIATKVAKEEGYPVGVLLGQAALETGRSVGSAPGNNFFGIKGSGNAGTTSQATQEDYGNGMVNITDNFAAYSNPEDSIRAYINLIKNNYPNAWSLRNDPNAMLRAIKAGGYATDPDYVYKVSNTPEFNYR